MHDSFQISLCTEMVFRNQPIHEILPIVRDAGYEAFEFWSWTNKDIESLAKAVSETGLRTAAFCVKHNNLVDAGERENFISGLQETLPVARQLGCRTLIVTTGQRLAGAPDEAQTESIVMGLRAAAPIAEDAGVTLVLEPLNTLVDHKGYFLDRSDRAFQILRDVDSPNVKLLFDIYHQQITEGNLIQNITQNIHCMGHFHAADVPGRHDPGSGEIHWRNVVKAIRDAGYQRAFGLEYSPSGDAIESIRDVLKLLQES